MLKFIFAFVGGFYVACLRRKSWYITINNQSKKLECSDIIDFLYKKYKDDSAQFEIFDYIIDLKTVSIQIDNVWYKMYK